MRDLRFDDHESREKKHGCREQRECPGRTPTVCVAAVQHQEQGREA